MDSILPRLLAQGSKGSWPAMNEHSTAPPCAIAGCKNISALSSTAVGRFWKFRTNYCAECYEKLLRGEALDIDTTLIIVEHSSATPVI
jgi:hypothetical protein